jgi:uncharacterized protein involved in cysteine biosynthesis
MQHNSTSQNVSDVLLTSSLVAAPAWAGWLDQFNQLLTTLSLVVGLIFGIARICGWCRRDRGPPKR